MTALMHNCFQIAGALTLPFDVVKTHKQIELGEAGFAVKGMNAGNGESAPSRARRNFLEFGARIVQILLEVICSSLPLQAKS